MIPSFSLFPFLTLFPPPQGHARKNSVTNSARELRGLAPPPPRAQSGSALARRPLPPPPAPKPLSPRTVAAIQIQSCVRRWYARRMLKRLRRRVAAVKEILSTEEQFVQKLRAFQSVFFAGMREAEGQGLLNPSDLAKIVGNWDDVVVYNTELLRQLRGRVGTFNAGCTVGDIFLGMRHFGTIYSAFLAGYDSALAVVTWHQKNNPPMAKLIRACEKVLGNTIESYLILPVQRIPRYVLLLRAVVQETDRAHPDHALCTQAAQKMEAVGTAVNERRREFEAEEQRQLQLRELTAQIAGLKMASLLDDNRRILLGPAEIVLLDCGEKRARAFVLLSDLFLLLEPYKSPGLTKVQRRRGRCDASFSHTCLLKGAPRDSLSAGQGGGAAAGGVAVGRDGRQRLSGGGGVELVPAAVGARQLQQLLSLLQNCRGQEGPRVGRRGGHCRLQAVPVKREFYFVVTQA